MVGDPLLLKYLFPASYTPYMRVFRDFVHQIASCVQRNTCLRGFTVIHSTNMTMEHQQEGRRLTLDFVREVFRQDEPDVEILELGEEPGSGRGDNYTSMLYRLRMNGRKRLKSGEWVPWATDIIYKVLPESKARREAYKSESLFQNEVTFYTKVWPALNDLQTEGKKVFGGVAKVYTAQSDLLVMEDLKRKGYVMADRRAGLEIGRLKIVLKALAGYHALSLTLKERSPDVFERLANGNGRDSVRECLFRMENEDWYRQYYRVAAKNAISMVSEAVSAEHPQRRQVIGKLQSFLHEDVFFRTMCELASAPGPFTVFCHGDCWTNNFLFAGEDCKDVEPVYLVDFQLIRVGSLALDLVYLLYCCAAGGVRQLHMTTLLVHYHKNLMSALHTLNPDKPKDSMAMWKLLNDEIRRCGRFGLGLAVDILPISTCDSSNAPDVYEGADDSSEEVLKIRAPPPGGVECAKLMADLTLELIENNAL